MKANGLGVEADDGRDELRALGKVEQSNDLDQVPLEQIAKARTNCRCGYRHLRGEADTFDPGQVAGTALLWRALAGTATTAFSQAYGEVNINLSTRLVPFDFGLDPFHGAIHYSHRDWQGVEYLELTRERVIPAAAPSLLARPVTSAADLLTMQLLHLGSRPGAWEAWFEQNGCKPERLRGMLFDQFTALAEAAMLGFGLLPEFLAEREFRSGRLVPTAAGYTDVDGAYFLVWPANTAIGPAIGALIDRLRRNG